MKHNIILIGFMGAGKTSIGSAYAQAHGCPLLDTDQLIEEEAGMPISQIFSSKGESAFRAAETAVLHRLLADTDHAVISVGGGLPLREENRRLLSRLGTIVFLRVSRDTVLKRLKGDTTRPLLQGGDTCEKVDKLLAERNLIYEKAAHLLMDVDDRTLDQLVAELEKKVGEAR